ncbi:hypothetical protein TNCV_1365351 [Trichonephila clavipes]|nr:hypothetical protein TNCV_1365351 [Trichonephila clavipes]
MPAMVGYLNHWATAALLKELKAILEWRNQHAGTVHRNSYAERSKVRPDANVSQAVLGCSNITVSDRRRSWGVFGKLDL